IIGAFMDSTTFYRAYLVAFLFVLGWSLGSLGLLMMQHLTGGHWGILIRRPLEAASRVLYLLPFLFIPLIPGMKALYSTHTVEGEAQPRVGWLDAPKPPHEGHLSDLQQWYLTHSGFLIRAAIYFAIWFFLMFIFNRMSRQQDVNRDDRALRARLKFWAGPGIMLYVFGMTFAAIDWAMSLSPHWASTIYGFLFVAGQTISALSLVIIVVVMCSYAEPFSEFIQKRHLHDLGKLLFAFNMLWAYFGFSQLLIIWSGNQPEEITFYKSRLYGSWGVVAVLVLVLHFFIPFFALLSRDLKRNKSLLPKIAMWLIVMRCLDLFWLTQPEFSQRVFPSAASAILYFATIIALGGIWLWFFARQLKQQPLLPLGEPKLAEAIAHHEH
ncbi:MAG TPA: hypothetical protein VKB24_04880, partial [Candidatus Acidoferrum sp.]|nr:hypothetical protein [Candidatus Acidoferrum sp.]